MDRSVLHTQCSHSRWWRKVRFKSATFLSEILARETECGNNDGRNDGAIHCQLSRGCPLSYGSVRGHFYASFTSMPSMLPTAVQSEATNGFFIRLEKSFYMKRDTNGRMFQHAPLYDPTFLVQFFFLLYPAPPSTLIFSIFYAPFVSSPGNNLRGWNPPSFVTILFSAVPRSWRISRGSDQLEAWRSISVNRPKEFSWIAFPSSSLTAHFIKRNWQPFNRRVIKTYTRSSSTPTLRFYFGSIAFHLRNVRLRRKIDAKQNFLTFRSADFHARFQSTEFSVSKVVEGQDQL